MTKKKAAIIDFVNFEKQKYIKSSSTFKSFTGIWAFFLVGQQPRNIRLLFVYLILNIF